MKAKLLIVMAIAGLCVGTPAFAAQRVVQTRNGRAVVVNTHGHDWRSSRVYWNVGIGFPFYGGGFYSGYPSYGGYYSGYPYYGGSYGAYPYGYGYSGYSYGYSNTYYYNSSSPDYNRYSYRNTSGLVVARVQQRLARDGYYRGAIDGVIGPRTHYAIRAYERNHGVPADGVIDHRLLRTMGLA